MMPEALPGKSTNLGHSMASFWKRLLGGKEEAPTAAHPLAAVTAREWKRIGSLLNASANANDGETNVRDRIGQLLSFYAAAGDVDKRLFLQRLCDDFATNEADVRQCISGYLEAGDTAHRTRAEGRLIASLESPRRRILRQFNLLPQGIHALVDMRADIFRLARSDALPGLEQDLLRLFTDWFDAGFLELKRIGWGSPASLLEKLIRYEAVHEIKSWSDLRNRLDSDRRCYAFFHGRMPEEPLIFIEVALVREVATSVQALLDESQATLDPEQATTAIFYSISNAQTGLRGVSMGEFLIKRVVQQLMHEYPRLRTFATLSPVPGFGRWLEKRLADPVYRAGIPAGIEQLLSTSAETCIDAIQTLLKREIDDGQANSSKLQTWLKSECAYYLLDEKSGQQPLDPVGRFHFSNGARLGQINWLADTSRHGLRQSFGLMVNYLYKFREIEGNHRAYAQDGSLATASAPEKYRQTARQRRRSTTTPPASGARTDQSSARVMQ